LKEIRHDFIATGNVAQNVGMVMEGGDAGAKLFPVLTLPMKSGNQILFFIVLTS